MTNSFNVLQNLQVFVHISHSVLIASANPGLLDISSAMVCQKQIQLSGIENKMFKVDKGCSSRGLTKQLASEQAINREHADSFFKAMQLPILIAQPFALMPIAGCTGNVSSLKFQWMNWRTLYSLLSILGATFLLAASLKPCFQYGFSYTKSTSVVFFLTGPMTTVYFIKVAKQWPQVSRQFQELEIRFQEYGYPKRQGLKFKLITLAFMSAALVEHALAIVTGYIKTQPCVKIENDILSSLEAFFLNSYGQVFSLTPYNLCKGVLVFIINVFTTFSWSYMDLFLALNGLALTARFRQLNQEMLKVKWQVKGSWFWRKLREEYTLLTVLTRRVDSLIQELMLIAIANNLFFICLQLLQSLSKTVNNYQVVYFFWSFGFLLIRTGLVTFCAAGVADESGEGRTVLFCSPSEGYCNEARRFLHQITSDDVSLTGCRFFSVTRGLLLTIAGTILTYEIVLVQFNTFTGAEHWPTYGNKTFCSKL